MTLLLLAFGTSSARAAPPATPLEAAPAPATREAPLTATRESTVPPAHEPTLPAPSEPTLVELQRAAVEIARLDPGRARSLERRLRASSLLPQLRVRVGRGTGQLLTTTDYDGNSRLSVGDRDAWQIDVSAAWSLDRLLFHPDELRLAREAERFTSHREHLLREVAELYLERLKLKRMVALARTRPIELAELTPRLEVVTSLLESLTGRPLATTVP